MPSAADPTPYVDPERIEQRDYFGHRATSSPLKQERLSQSSEGTIISGQHSIPRKPVGSPSRRQDNESSITTIHNAGISSPVRLHPLVHAAPSSPSTGRGKLEFFEQKSPATSSTRSPSQRLESFLEKAVLLEIEDPQERRASVISFQSVSTKQVQIQPPSAQNQRNPSRQARIITCLNELPPITLKDPFTARIPSSHPTKESHPVVCIRLCSVRYYKHLLTLISSGCRPQSAEQSQTVHHHSPACSPPPLLDQIIVSASRLSSMVKATL